MLNCFLRFFAVWTHLSVGSVDGVEVFVKSTVTSNQVKDGSVAHLVLTVVVVKLANDRELISRAQVFLIGLGLSWTVKVSP